jgi:hypothetical protein
MTLLSTTLRGRIMSLLTLSRAWVPITADGPIKDRLGFLRDLCPCSSNDRVYLCGISTSAQKENRTPTPPPLNKNNLNDDRFLAGRLTATNSQWGLLVRGDYFQQPRELSKTAAITCHVEDYSNIISIQYGDVW